MKDVEMSTAICVVSRFRSWRGMLNTYFLVVLRTIGGKHAQMDRS
jgi:hypothetical protein